MQTLKNLIFFLLQGAATLIYAVVVCLLFWLPARRRNLICAGYTRLMLWLAHHLCGIEYEIIGLENLPDKPHLVLSKHSSTWETMALEALFAPASFVAKRELLWVPFFGWGFALASPITINRSAGAQAMEQMVAQGKERLFQRGFTVVVFPEGTRIAAGKRGKYKTGGTRLALGCGVPIIPVAHNAGYCWPRHPWKKYPGKITLSILPPIATTGRGVTEIQDELERVIEDEVARLGNGRRGG